MDEIMSDWASSRGRCLTKALLDSLSDDGESGFEVYYKYLDTSLLFDEDVNFSALSRFGHASKSIVSRYQYRLSEPAEEPAHFSFFSQHDVNRLSTLCGREIVIYSYDDRRRVGRIPAHLDPQFWKAHFDPVVGLENPAELHRRRSRLTVFHDFRSLEMRQDGEQPRAFYLVTCKTPRRLFRLPDDSDLDEHVSAWFGDPDGRKADARSDDGRDDFLAACDLALSPDAPLDRSRRDVVVSRPSDFLASDRPYLYNHWMERFALRGEDASAPGCFIVVTFCRLAGKSPLVRSNALPPGRNFRFITLAVASPRSDAANVDEADFVTPDTVVLCIFADRFVCRLSETYRLAVAVSHLHAKGLKERLLNRTNFSGVAKVLTEEQREEARQAEVEKERRRREQGKKPKKPKAERASDKIKKKCRCGDCRSNLYSSNMSRAGPERLCSSPYTARELLRLLGMLDKESTTLIERLLELSIAAMDLESQTRPLEMEGPLPGPGIFYPEIAGPILEGHVKKVQRPIMIGHTDALTRERGERWRDTVDDDSVSAVFSMFARYWLRVSRLHRQSRDLKLKTAESLMEATANYQRAFYAYSDRWSQFSREERAELFRQEQEDLCQRNLAGALAPGAFQVLMQSCCDRYSPDSDDWTVPDAKTLTHAFYQMPPGLLRTQLGKICNRYIVFSFYG